MDAGYPNFMERSNIRNRIDHYESYFNSDDSKGIPKLCCCGQGIVKEISQNEADKGIRYFSCKKFKSDGWHIRKTWDTAIEEEVKKLTRIVEDHSALIRKFGEDEIILQQLRREMDNKDEEVRDVKKLLTRVASRVEKLSGPTHLYPRLRI